MIWVKRLVPLILAAGIWAGFHFGGEYLKRRETIEQDRLALVTAKVWIATAKYREEPDRFLEYRDSLLAAEHVSREDLYSFLDRYEHDPENTMPFALRVQAYVDSLVTAEEAFLRDTKIQAADSLRAADRRRP